MRNLIAAITFIITIPQLVQAKTPRLAYIFQKRDSTSMLITVSFTGSKSGVTLLHLPNEWAGQKMLYKTISQITAVSKGASIDTTGKPDEYRVKYAPGADVALTYVLTKDWTGPLVYPKYFRPVIANDFFFFEGYSGLAYPDIADSVQLKCTIEYKGFANTDFFGNSFFANESKHSFTTTIKTLTNSFFCAGNYRTKTVEVNGHKIVMAVSGKFIFTDEDVYNAISKIIFAERKFWDDESSRYFFTVLMPMPDKGNWGGTAHYNSFYLFQSTDVSIARGAVPLISHEYFHNWIGQGLVMPKPSEIYNWFSEGFTDYYAYKLPSLAGITTTNDFKAKMNTYIKEYYLSPHFNIDNQALIGRFWENNDLKQLAYRRGLTIAFVLDTRIREKGTGSLDDLMKELYAKSKPGLMFSKALFDTLVIKYAGAETLAAINNANAGRNDELTRDLLDNKIYKTSSVTISKIFDIGFDLDASKKAKKLTGLKPGSNAEKAGLKEGMDITNNFSIWHGSTEKPLKVQIVRDGKQEWITYAPVASVNMVVPQLVIE